MNLETRKIEFITAFLKLQNEDVISSLEKVLHNESLHSTDDLLKPMTMEELNCRIDQSEKDFENDSIKTSSELLSKYA